MKDNQKISFIEYLTLKSELHAAYENGTRLMVDGIHVYPEEAASACTFREESLYMYRRGSERPDIM